jgi:hypothetical protein
MPIDMKMEAKTDQELLLQKCCEISPCALQKEYECPNQEALMRT